MRTDLRRFDTQFIAMSSRLKTLRLVLFVLLSSSIEFVRGQEEVYIYDGRLTGTTLTTRNGREIQAFRGIPYAKPPVGPLRFKSPVPAEPWDDILAADTDRNQCPQFGDDGAVVGDEDCLYLNVYTPEILSLEKTEYLFPTMVYIHGGNFVRGNGSSMTVGPGYLLDTDVVLVTINYRLGVLGFLSTGDGQAPGNFGLKDQVLALKWVQNNVVFFGGDRDRVTIFGQDAGGASAQLHGIFDASNGLFNQYISQSGTAMCFWAYTDNIDYKEYATKLGKYLKCPTTNSKVLIDCLRRLDVYSLVDSDDIFSDTFYRFKTWGPTDEPKLSGAFLTMHPYEKILIDETKDYRSIIGHVADEGLILTAQLYTNSTMYEKIANNLDAFLLYITEISLDHLTPTRYAETLKKLYFNGQGVPASTSEKEIFTKNLTNLISDAAFLYTADYVSRLLHYESKSTIYFYSFEYRGTFSKTSRVIGSNENIGVTHTDDLTYLFPTSTEQFHQRQLELSESDEQMIDTMIDLWTSFAYTGIPRTKRFSDPNFWQPYTDSRNCLIIGNNSDTSLSLQDNFHLDRFSFWDYLLFDQVYGGYLRAITNH